LQQSGGVPTNRITSVTNGGTTVNYTYDANGNVTNDGVHTYVYDAENRVASVDSGTVQYRYDHQNRRVCKIAGASWTHYIWEGSQVIAEHDATTAYTSNPTYQVNSARADYIYSRNRLIWNRQRASSGSAWTSRYYLSDRLSTRLVLDTGGNVVGRQAHLPFGEDFAETGTQEKHHFTNC
jgi:YD repeat-containing protein